MLPSCPSSSTCGGELGGDSTTGRARVLRREELELERELKDLLIDPNSFLAPVMAAHKESKNTRTTTPNGLCEGKIKLATPSVVHVSKKSQLEKTKQKQIKPKTRKHTKNKRFLQNF